MRQIKVLHITGSLDKNGTETFLMNVFRNINKKTFSFDFLIFNKSKGDGFEDEVMQLGGKIYILTSRRKSLIKYYKELKDFL